MEPYGSSDLGGDPSDDEPSSMTSASPSEDDDPEDPKNPSGRKKKKKRRTRRPEGRRSQDARAIATSKIVVNLPEFTGKDLSESAENFGRFRRMTGQTHASGRVKCDLLLQCCKTKYLEKQVKQIVTKSATFANVLVALERQYPTYETDLLIKAEIQNLAVLPNNLKPGRFSELLADLDHWAGRLTPVSYSSHNLLFWLVAKLPRELWDECRSTAQRKARAVNYEDLCVLLLELALEKESDQHLNPYRPGGGGSGGHGKGYQGPRPGQGTTPKHACIMDNVKELFWCYARDEQGHLQHVPDCEQRDCFVVEGKKQETNTGAKAKMTDHYRCTITCAFGGNRKHYEDECYHKQRLSAKLKGEDPGKGSGKGGGKGNRLTLGDLKDRLRPQDAIETIPEYVLTNTNAPNSPCHVPVPDGVSGCGLSGLPSSIHSHDETEHDALFVQTCVEEVENAEYVAPLQSLLSLRVENPVDEELDTRSRLREYVDSKRRLVAKRLCYAKATRSSWPLKQGRMGDLSQLKEDLEQMITTWQREVDLKLMKSVWGAHVRTPEEDELSEEFVCEPPRACLCCHRPPEMVERDLRYAYQGLKDTTRGEESVEDHLPSSITQGASNLHSDEDMEDKIKLLDPRVQKLIRTYLDVFVELPPPASCDKLVQMDLKLKPESVGHKIRRTPYPAPKEQAEEIERQIQECIDAGLVLEYKDGDYPQHCSPCFLVAKSGSTAKRLVVDYEELNKKTLNHLGSIPYMESTLEKIASCRYKTKMDKSIGFWQVDLTPNAQELLAFIIPHGRVFKWKVMPFRVANAPALFHEVMNKILSILRRRPKVQELISRGAQMEAHIDDVSLGTNTQEDHLILLNEFFAVCQENHTRLKLENCEFMQETMQYLGFDGGYGWPTPAASKAKPLMDANVRHKDPKKGLHDVRSFIGACNFYRRHIKHFTYTSAILTDLIKKSTTWRWGPQEQQAFDELKDKVANAKCLGMPKAQGEIILLTDASNVRGGGTLFQWQALEKEEFDSAIFQWGTEGLNRERTLKHSYPDDKWVLVPLSHWNSKWNQTRGSTPPMSRNCLRVCWCYPHKHNCWGVTLWSGCATKSRSARFRRVPHLGRPTYGAGGPTSANYG